MSKELIGIEQWKGIEDALPVLSKSNPFKELSDKLIVGGADLIAFSMHHSTSHFINGNSKLFITTETVWEYGPRAGETPAHIELFGDNFQLDKNVYEIFQNSLTYLKKIGAQLYYNPNIKEILGKERFDANHWDNWASVLLHQI